jgi:hypothetical protein
MRQYVSDSKGLVSPIVFAGHHQSDTTLTDLLRSQLGQLASSQLYQMGLFLLIDMNASLGIQLFPTRLCMNKVAMLFDKNQLKYICSGYTEHLYISSLMLVT